MTYRNLELEKKVIDLYDSGFSYVDIGKEIGKYPSYVRNVCHRYGRTERNLTTRQKTIYNLFKDGHSVKSISEIVGSKQKNVRKTLQTAGLLEVQKKHKAHCANCGNEFVARDNRAKYCCKACEKEASHKTHDAERRSREKEAIVDRDITLPRLCERDNHTCYLCGGKVDWNDYVIVNGRKKPKGNYPSIDHVKPLALGGRHCWSNVRLAHMRCNAKKGVKLIG